MFVFELSVRGESKRMKKGLLILWLIFFPVYAFQVEGQQLKSPQARVEISIFRDDSADKVCSFSQCDKGTCIYPIQQADEEEANSDSLKECGRIKVKVTVTNLSNQEDLAMPTGWQTFRPTLFRNGKLVSYLKEVEDTFQEIDRTSIRTIRGIFRIKPNEAYEEILELEDIYGVLEEGEYQLSVEKSFFYGNKIVSNTITFKIDFRESDAQICEEVVKLRAVRQNVLSNTGTKN